MALYQFFFFNPMSVDRDERGTWPLEQGFEVLTNVKILYEMAWLHKAPRSDSDA